MGVGLSCRRFCVICRHAQQPHTSCAPRHLPGEVTSPSASNLTAPCCQQHVQLSSRKASLGSQEPHHPHLRGTLSEPPAPDRFLNSYNAPSSGLLALHLWPASMLATQPHVPMDGSKPTPSRQLWASLPASKSRPQRTCPPRFQQILDAQPQTCTLSSCVSQIHHSCSLSISPCLPLSVSVSLSPTPQHTHTPFLLSPLLTCPLRPSPPPGLWNRAHPSLSWPQQAARLEHSLDQLMTPSRDPCDSPVT